MTRDQERIEQDRGRHTPARLRHPALDPMASYASAFGTRALKRVEEDLHHFFCPDDFIHLQERLEFSLAWGGPAQLDLRYILYRLFETDRIETYFRDHGYPQIEAVRIMDIMGPVTPEFAIGNDFSRDRERLKLYSMRLDSHKDRMPDVASAVEKLSREFHIPVNLPSGGHFDDITLIGVDFYPHSDRRDLKIYTVLPVDRSQIMMKLEEHSAGAVYLKKIMEFMENGADNEPGTFIQCFRFSTTKSRPIGYALFSHIQPNLRLPAEDAVRKILPEGHPPFQQFFERVRSLGWEAIVGNIGASLSYPDDRERFHVYFSVI